MSTYGEGFLVDESTGDLNVTNNDFNFLEKTEDSLRQRLELRLNTWREEWPYNEEFGLPVRKIMKMSGLTDRAQIEAEFIAQVNLEPDVTAIKSFQMDFDPDTRAFKAKRIEVYHDSGVYSLGLVNPDATRYEYPTPVAITDAGVCKIDPVLNAQVTDVHHLLNTGMVLGGTHSWYNSWSTDPSTLINIIDSHHTLMNTDMTRGGSSSWWSQWLP